MQSLREIASVIGGMKSAVIFTHTRPDGDTIGSGLALYYALKKLNIPCEICNDSEIPEKYRFMPGAALFQKTPTLPFPAGYIAVDSAEPKRLGLLEGVFSRAGKRVTVNIDHHVSNSQYAQYNYVRECAANCRNVAELLSLLGVKPDKEIADALMLGLVTDSGNFSHGDVDGDIFRTAGELMDAGADVNTITYEAFRRQSKARAALYADTMSGLRYLLDDRFAVIVVRKAELEKYGVDQSATEGFVDFPLSVEGVEVAAALLEVKFRQYKISLRSKGWVNVNAVAAVYGGGGHILASGCMLFGEEEEVIDKLRYTVSQFLD